MSTDYTPAAVIVIGREIAAFGSGRRAPIVTNGSTAIDGFSGGASLGAKLPAMRELASDTGIMQESLLLECNTVACSTGFIVKYHGGVSRALPIIRRSGPGTTNPRLIQPGRARRDCRILEPWRGSGFGKDDFLSICRILYIVLLLPFRCVKEQSG